MNIDPFDESKSFFEKKRFPEQPFQLVLIDKKYCERYCLPYHTVVTVTNVRYSIEKKEIRYSLLDAFFDFPWSDESCEVIHLYSSN